MEKPNKAGVESIIDGGVREITTQEDFHVKIDRRATVSIWRFLRTKLIYTVCHIFL